MQAAERFDARSVRWFLRIYGVALVADVATELFAGVWHVHTGRFYPWRHIDIVPLYPAWTLAIEWALRATAGLALVTCAARTKIVALAARAAAVVLFVAVLERYSNHGVLLFLVAFFLALMPIDVTSPSFETTPHPALGLVRAQLVIVYVFSAINKLTHGFGSGASLANLLGAGPPTATLRLLSWLVIAGELALPFLLWKRPRIGIAMAVVMHLAFSALVPGVTSFGLTMIAMAMLFLRADARAGSSG
jgi:hypothetical protein